MMLELWLLRVTPGKRGEEETSSNEVFPKLVAKPIKVKAISDQSWPKPNRFAGAFPLRALHIPLFRSSSLGSAR